MSVSIEEVGEHTAKHGSKLFKNKKFLIIAGVVAALGLFMYMKNKNAASSTGTAAFSNYPTPPSETGNIPTNVGSGSVDTGSAGGTYDPTTTSNDPYSANLGNSTAPLMTPVMYQPPIANVPQQQLESGTITKAGVAPGGFETMTGDNYTQQGNKVTVTDAMGDIGTYDMASHNYTWDSSKQTAPNVGYTPPAGTVANFSTILKSDGTVSTPQALGLDNNKIGADGLTDYTRAAKAALLAGGGTNYQAASSSPAQPATVSHHSSSSYSSNSFSKSITAGSAGGTPEATHLNNTNVGSDGRTDYTRAARAAAIAAGGKVY